MMNKLNLVALDDWSFAGMAQYLLKLTDFDKTSKMFVGVDIQFLLILLCLPPAIYQYSIWIYRVFKMFRTRKEVKKESSETLTYHPFSGKPESVRYGSDPFDSTWPPCQAILWIKTENGLERNACAWRFGDYLVTASHALPYTDGRLLISAGDHAVQVCDYKVVYDYDELAVLEIPISIFTTLQLKSAKVSPTDDAMVRVTGCEAFRSTTAGILTPTNVLGVYKYSGTTKAGYSGAPYLVGDNSVAAMHCFGGDSGNLCISARYIQMVVQQLIIPVKLKDKLKIYGPVLATTNAAIFGDTSSGESVNRATLGRFIKENCKFVKESKGKNKKKRCRVCEDWYFENLDNVKEIRTRRSRRQPDAYEFKLNDNYYTVDGDDFCELRELARKKTIAVYLDGLLLESVHPNHDDDEDIFLEESSQPDLNMWEEHSHYTEIQEVLREIRTLRTDFLTCNNSRNLNSTHRRASEPRERMVLRS